jgi:hypothetical protein
MSLLTNQSAVNSSRTFWQPFGNGGGGGGSSNPTFSNVTVLQNISASGQVSGSSMNVANNIDATTGNFVNANVQSNLNVGTINNAPYPPGGGGGSNFVVLNCSTLNALNSINTSTINLNTINGSAYPPPSGGIGGRTDLEFTLTSNSVPQYIGQNRYFNLNVSTTVTDPIASIDPGGTVGGNWVQISHNDVGSPPVPIYAQGNPIDIVNGNAQSVQTLIYSGAGNSLQQTSGWHRIGSLVTPILDDTMVAYPLQVSDSNMALPNTISMGDYQVNVLGGNQNLISLTGGITYQSGAQSTDDFVFVAVTDAAGKQPVGGFVHIPNGYTTTVPFSFTGLNSLTTGFSSDCRHLTYQILAGSNALYAVEVTNACLVQL